MLEAYKIGMRVVFLDSDGDEHVGVICEIGARDKTTLQALISRPRVYKVYVGEKPFHILKRDILGCFS